MSYRPKEPFTVVAKLLNPTTSIIKGVTIKSYKPIGNIHCSFKTYGGTEIVKNEVLTVLDTASVETWYRPDITSASRLIIGTNIYEVIGEPENIDQRNQFLKLKVRGVKGGA